MSTLLLIIKQVTFIDNRSLASSENAKVYN